METKTRKRLTPGDLRARADEMERKHTESAGKKAAKLKQRAAKALRAASKGLTDVEPELATQLGQIAEKLEA